MNQSTSPDGEASEATASSRQPVDTSGNVNPPGSQPTQDVTSYFVRLPREIMNGIIDELPESDLGNLALVHSTWLEPCRASMLRTVNIRRRWGRNIRSCPRLLTLVARHTRKIELHSLCLLTVVTRKHTGNHVPTADELCEELSTALQMTIQAASNLEVAEIDLGMIASADRYSKHSDPFLLAETFSGKAQLRALHLGFRTSYSTVHHRLDRHLEMYPENDNFGICQAIRYQQWPALRCVSLQHLEHIDFSMTGEEEGDPHHLMTFLQELPNLKHLCISNAGNALNNPEILAQLVPPTLESFEWTDFLGHTSFSRALEVLSARITLEHLDLRLHEAAWRHSEQSNLTFPAVVSMTLQFADLLDFHPIYGRYRRFPSYRRTLNDPSVWADPPNAPIFPALRRLALCVRAVEDHEASDDLVESLTTRLRWWRGYCPRLGVLHLIASRDAWEERRSSLCLLRDKVADRLRSDPRGEVKVVLEPEDETRFLRTDYELRV